MMHAVSNSQRWDRHLRGAGGRMVGTLLSVTVVRFDSGQQCTPFLTVWSVRLGCRPVWRQPVSPLLVETSLHLATCKSLESVFHGSFPWSGDLCRHEPHRFVVRNGRSNDQQYTSGNPRHAARVGGSVT